MENWPLQPPRTNPRLLSVAPFSCLNLTCPHLYFGTCLYLRQAWDTGTVYLRMNSWSSAPTGDWHAPPRLALVPASDTPFSSPQQTFPVPPFPLPLHSNIDHWRWEVAIPWLPLRLRMPLILCVISLPSLLSAPWTSTVPPKQHIKLCLQPSTFLLLTIVKVKFITVMATALHRSFTLVVSLVAVK